MSEFLDALDDAGVDDKDTRAFLVEALGNAEESEWSDVLEPFVNGGLQACLAALTLDVLAKSRHALAKEVKEVEGEKISPLALAFLQTLHPGILFASGLHTVARCARTCRAAHEATQKVDLWQSHALRTCARWSLPAPRGRSIPWRTEFLRFVRPRCDGIYVGECGFQRWVRVGHHTDLRKNSAQLAAYGGRGGQAEWVRYRRYLRLLPLDEMGRHRAMVLQDPCPRHAAEDVLVAGVDFATHCNPVKSEGLPEGAVPHAGDAERLRKRICVGDYEFDREKATIIVKYTAVDGEYRLTFSLSGHRCSDCLTWEHYEMEDQVRGELIPFNLGRLPDWKGGGLEDEGKDHFPEMNFRPQITLEHLVWVTGSPFVVAVSEQKAVAPAAQSSWRRIQFDVPKQKEKHRIL